MKIIIKYQIMDNTSTSERSIVVDGYNKANAFIDDLKFIIRTLSETNPKLTWYSFTPLMRVIK